MGKQRLTGYVHVRKGAETVTLAPGDILPKWAKDIVTNPDVLEDADNPSTPDEPDDDASADETIPSTGSSDIVTDESGEPGDDGDEPQKSFRELQQEAKDLGLSAAGKAEDIAARIAEHKASGAPDGDGTRPALEAKATELGVAFTADTTDVELEALIAAKE